MHPKVEIAIKKLQNAEISEYFMNLQEVVPEPLKYRFNELKADFIARNTPSNFHQILDMFAREVDGYYNGFIYPYNKLIINSENQYTIAINIDGYDTYSFFLIYSENVSDDLRFNGLEIKLNQAVYKDNFLLFWIKDKEDDNHPNAQLNIETICNNSVLGDNLIGYLDGEKKIKQLIWVSYNKFQSSFSERSDPDRRDLIGIPLYNSDYKVVGFVKDIEGNIIYFTKDTKNSIISELKRKIKSSIELLDFFKKYKLPIDKGLMQEDKEILCWDKEMPLINRFKSEYPIYHAYSKFRDIAIESKNNVSEFHLIIIENLSNLVTSCKILHKKIHNIVGLNHFINSSDDTTYKMILLYVALQCLQKRNIPICQDDSFLKQTDDLVQFLWDKNYTELLSDEFGYSALEYEIERNERDKTEYAHYLEMAFFYHWSKGNTNFLGKDKDLMNKSPESKKLITMLTDKWSELNNNKYNTIGHEKEKQLFNKFLSLFKEDILSEDNDSKRLVEKANQYIDEYIDLNQLPNYFYPYLRFYNILFHNPKNEINKYKKSFLTV